MEYKLRYLETLYDLQIFHSWIGKKIEQKTVLKHSF